MPSLKGLTKKLAGLTLTPKSAASLEVGDTYVTDAGVVFTVKMVSVEPDSGSRPCVFTLAVEGADGKLQPWRFQREHSGNYPLVVQVT
jgi:hypothetical protein